MVVEAGKRSLARVVRISYKFKHTELASDYIATDNSCTVTRCSTIQIFV